MFDDYNTSVTYKRNIGKDKFNNIIYSTEANTKVRFCKGEMVQKLTTTGMQSVFQKTYHAPIDLMPKQGDLIDGVKVVQLAQSIGVDGRQCFWRVWCE